MIGVNAVLLESAEIGDNCVIGAGAIVLADTVVPPNSVVVGVPGKVHPLKPELLNRIKSASEHYRENAKRFKAAGLSAKAR